MTRTPRTLLFALTSLAAFLLPGCRRSAFPDVPVDYREFAYVANSGSNTVSVLDLVYLRQDRVLQVGREPSDAVANPRRNEIYIVNTGDGTVTVIDTTSNRIVNTIGVHNRPYALSVDAAGRMAYVANSAANNVSVIDLETRREIATVGTGEAPGLARISPDMRSLVVTNRVSGSVSIYDVAPAPREGTRYTPPHLRATFDHCPGATDEAILPDSSKVFIACPEANQVMAISLAAAPGSWSARQDGASLHDRFLTRLVVGKSPVHLALKPDGGEIFVSNSRGNSITEISTWTNEVGGTYPIGPEPVRGIVANDDSTLWVATFGADSATIYSIDDGRRISNVHTGPAPDAMAFSADEHLLLVANSRSGDVSVIRTNGRDGPGLFTMLPAGSNPAAIAVKSFQAK